jgi:hypothetical protein
MSAILFPLLWAFIAAGAANNPSKDLPAWAIPQPIPTEKIPTLRAQDLANTIPLIGADAAWKAGFRGAGVNILIIDDFSGEPSHGLWVSGIIHAIAPDTQIWHISLPSLDDADVVVALEGAYRDQPQKGYTLLNYSLGSKQPYAPSCTADSTFPDELQNTQAQFLHALKRDQGVLSVVATGNSGDPFQIDFPACLEGDVLPAAASWDVTITQGFFIFENCQQQAVVDEPMCFSNSSLEYPPLYAPGFQSDVPRVGQNNQLNSGTSASAPVILGATALLTQALRAAGETITPDQLRQLLYQTGTVISDPRNGGRFSRVNLSAALAAWPKNGTSHPISAQPSLIEVAVALDIDQNRLVDDGEMVKAVGLWVTGSVVPGTNDAVIDDAIIVQLTMLWVKQMAF